MDFLFCLSISATKKGGWLESALAVLGFGEFWSTTLQLWRFFGRFLEYNASALAVFWTFFGVQRFSFGCKSIESCCCKLMTGLNEYWKIRKMSLRLKFFKKR
jgi:hypothetical protein